MAPSFISASAVSSTGFSIVNVSGKAQAGRKCEADVASFPYAELWSKVRFERQNSLSKASRSRVCREVSLGLNEDHLTMLAPHDTLGSIFQSTRPSEVNFKRLLVAKALISFHRWGK